MPFIFSRVFIRQNSLYYIVYLQYFDMKTLQHLMNFPHETEKLEAFLVINNWRKGQIRTRQAMYI